MLLNLLQTLTKQYLLRVRFDVQRKNMKSVVHFKPVTTVCGCYTISAVVKRYYTYDIFLALA